MAFNSKKIDFKIVTQERVVYQDEVDQVTAVTQSGEITILSRHTALVSTLRAGEMLVKKDGREVLLAVAGGVLEVRPGNQVVILAERAERAEDIDLGRAESARQRAEELLQQKELASDMAYATLQTILEKELTRIKVGRKYRNLPLN